MRMVKTNFENLRVYQLSEELADLTWDIVIKWKRLAQGTVGVQLIKAADSIGANIAEGTDPTAFDLRAVGLCSVFDHFETVRGRHR